MAHHLRDLATAVNSDDEAAIWSAALLRPRSPLRPTGRAVPGPLPCLPLRPARARGGFARHKGPTSRKEHTLPGNPAAMFDGLDFALLIVAHRRRTVFS